jgi:hypothetical protein
MGHSSAEQTQTPEEEEDNCTKLSVKKQRQFF